MYLIRPRALTVCVLLAAMILAAITACAAIDDKAGTPKKLASAFMPLRTPPAGAIVLFNGKDLHNWRRRDGQPATWKIKDGVMTASGGDIMTQLTFEDAFIHVEFREPKRPDPARGNSGVYLQGRYELQVIDSYGTNLPGKGDCGGIYAQFAPLVNASKPPLEWQSYDVVFRAPRVDDSGKVIEQARMTVLQNDILIHNNVQVLGPTGSALDDKVTQPGPLLLQDHGSPVQYRNVWMVRLPLKGSDTYEGR